MIIIKCGVIVIKWPFFSHLIIITMYKNARSDRIFFNKVNPKAKSSLALDIALKTIIRGNACDNFV
jgi:hypothetical protein